MARTSAANRSSPISREGVRVNVTGRRTYSVEYKRAVVNECVAPNVSVAAIGLKHGINDNLLRRWIRAQQMTMAATTAPILLPVKVNIEAGRAGSRDDARATAETSGCIEIDIGDVRMRVRGVVDANTLRCVLHELRRS